MHVKICPNCSKEFTTDMSYKKYCSNECTKEYNIKKSHNKRSEKRNLAWDNVDKKRVCPICNSDFEITKTHRTKKYCSKKCRQKAERVVGCKSETDSIYKDKIRFDGNREKTLQRDDYTCTMCGKKNDLVVHHIDCSGQCDNPNNELDNLTTLCRRCHINLHKILERNNNN